MVWGIIIGLILAIVFLGGGIFLGMLLSFAMEEHHSKREMPYRYRPVKPVSYSDYYRKDYNYYHGPFSKQEKETQEDNSEHEDDRDF